MFKLSIVYTFVLLFVGQPMFVKGQPVFNYQIKPDNSSLGGITGIAQDQQGYLWISSNRIGLSRYDGHRLITYTKDPNNQNSLSSKWVECLFIDSLDVLWLGTWGEGLNRFDPATNTFTHFRHNPKDPTSLSNDTVTTILRDHVGNLWIGTYGGLDLLDVAAGKFSHHTHQPKNPASLSHNHVRALYEDRQGTLWVGCGSPWGDVAERDEEGGLNRFNRKSNDFTRYLHDPNNPGSIANNKVRALLEDSKGNFWVGTAGDGLHIMDRVKGTFTHYYYDSDHPDKLSRPPLSAGQNADHITFINEDAKANIWIGTLNGGISKYDPYTKKVTPYGWSAKMSQPIDTLAGLNLFDKSSLSAGSSSDGILWIGTLGGGLYTVNPLITPISYFEIGQSDSTSSNMSYAFYKENKDILWVGTSNGLFRKHLPSGALKKYAHSANNPNSPGSNFISSIRELEDSMLLVSAFGAGLDKLNPSTGTFTPFKRASNSQGGLISDSISYVYIDHLKNIWVSTIGSGLSMLDTKTGFFKQYKHDDRDTNSLSNNDVFNIIEDQQNNVWVATGRGLNKLSVKTGNFGHYFQNSTVNFVYVDAEGVVWAGMLEGLYRYNFTSNNFSPYTDSVTKMKIDNVMNILEDDNKELWINTRTSLVRINEKRNGSQLYGTAFGVRPYNYGIIYNYKAKDGELYFGGAGGYYAFYPDKISNHFAPPKITITRFQIGSREIKTVQNNTLNIPIYKADHITLKHNQNSFSFGFTAFHYRNPAGLKYQYMLENYDNIWHDEENTNTANFFSVPPGHYIFKVRAISTDGTWGEKSIDVIVLTPWWLRWWAFALYALLLFFAIWGFSYYRSRSLVREKRLLEEKVKLRTEEVMQQKEEIAAQRDNLEQTLDDLRATQTQLVQREKMASLGELTAGIAHEIQNPLNFVNNFSEVNSELLNELREELSKAHPNHNLIKELIRDSITNLEKINEHGKRADSIVKGMLQHSRNSSGLKQPTDLNALCDEYLKLSYHGLRARDKSFNALINTDYDSRISNVTVVPEELGRVLLNLYNNAFFSIMEKKKKQSEGYEPELFVTTKVEGNRVLISVKDNGIGISKENVEKIFQPFFTTKPSGQGTGLGLSISYDIIKAHKGEITVDSKEGEGACFIVSLPYE